MNSCFGSTICPQKVNFAVYMDSYFLLSNYLLPYDLPSKFGICFTVKILNHEQWRCYLLCQKSHYFECSWSLSGCRLLHSCDSCYSYNPTLRWWDHSELIPVTTFGLYWLVLWSGSMASVMEFVLSWASTLHERKCQNQTWCWPFTTFLESSHDRAPSFMVSCLLRIVSLEYAYFS